MDRKAPAVLAIISFLLPPLAAQVKLTKGADRISVEIGGKPFTEFYIGSDTVKPYLHPLRAASGTIVTRRYPMEIVEGEAKDHPHHRGLWFTHGDVNGVDFWANEPAANRPKAGKVSLRRVLSVRDGGGKRPGSIEALFDWVDPLGKVLLTERRAMLFHDDATLRIVDCDITLTAVEEVKFGDTKEGTFAIRLATELQETRSGKMVTSDGRETEKNVWGTRAKWVDYFGDIRGEKLGVAMFDHPANPRHPTYWHARAYGLFAANIFGLHDFLRDNSQDGSLLLAPGRSVRFRYRVVIHPGDYRSSGIEALYQQFAQSGDAARVYTGGR